MGTGAGAAAGVAAGIGARAGSGVGVGAGADQSLPHTTSLSSGVIFIGWIHIY